MIGYTIPMLIFYSFFYVGTIVLDSWFAIPLMITSAFGVFVCGLFIIQSIGKNQGGK